MKSTIGKNLRYGSSGSKIMLYANSGGKIMLDGYGGGKIIMYSVWLKFVDGKLSFQEVSQNVYEDDSDARVTCRVGYKKPGDDE